MSAVPTGRKRRSDADGCNVQRHCPPCEWWGPPHPYRLGDTAGTAAARAAAEADGDAHQKVCPHAKGGDRVNTR